MNKQHITLRDDDRATLERLLSAGTLSARKFKRATGLLELDRGKTLQDVAATLHVHYTTVATWRDAYTASGLDCLEEAPRSGRPVEIDGTLRAKMTALACSDAPEGHARWSLRLLADKAVESGLCEHLSHTLVRDILKKTNSSRT
jgi:transposase